MPETSDATGAGDTFAGAGLAMLASSERAIKQATWARMAAATACLEQCKVIAP